MTGNWIRWIWSRFFFVIGNCLRWKILNGLQGTSRVRFIQKKPNLRKPLTNVAFNRFGGGEKAMAMDVPLFGAVNA